ncbi:MAG TPA: DUF1003 domain-containing protein [Gammaproteobacteria bacterium]|nr:DUF1003 domain-containing protein [Gammaproteobacteria bacterium]
MTHQSPLPHGSDRPGMTHIMERNIRALLERRRQEEQDASWQDRLARRITFFTGSLRFVYLHLALFGLWVVINLPWVPLPHFDPTFVVLAMVASVEAIFLSTFILITQNRMTAQAEKHADLDLQISLLAVHEITRLITLVTGIAARLGIDAAQDPELAELAQDVVPEQVLDTMEAQQHKVSNDEGQRHAS